MSKKIGGYIVSHPNICMMIGLIIIVLWAAIPTVLGDARVVRESSKNLTTLHTGESFLYSCGKSFSFVALTATDLDHVTILQGVLDGKLFKKNYKIGDHNKKMALGCLRIDIVDDPYSNYMLEIYIKP